METTESSSPNSDSVYDEIRRAWVRATPEEKVRQILIRKMVFELSYPRELISVERSLKDLCGPNVNGKIPTRRVDITSFAKGPSGLYPLLIIECKEHETLIQEALRQVHGYNFFLKAPFVAVAYPGGEVFGYLTKNGFSYFPYIPSYQDLLSAVRNG